MKYQFNTREEWAIVIGCALIVIWLVLVVLWLIKMMKLYTWNTSLLKKTLSKGVANREEPQCTDNTLNLPPGSMRAVLTLTLLVVVIVLVCISMFVTQLKGQFDSLVEAFELMIAFYFGSKIMDSVSSNDKIKSVERSKNEAIKSGNLVVDTSASASPFEDEDSEG